MGYDDMTDEERARFRAWCAEQDALTTTSDLTAPHCRWLTWRDDFGNKWAWNNTHTGGNGLWTVTAPTGGTMELDPEGSWPWTRIDWRGADYVPEPE